MKIILQTETGERKTITLVPPITIRDRDGLNVLACGDGTEHFFTQDGYYDGWGRAVAPGDGPFHIAKAMAIVAKALGHRIRDQRTPKRKRTR
jgi:hypothetical protein